MSSKCAHCIYGSHITETHYCKYLALTGCSRLKVVYKRLGVDHVTDEVREAMRPEHCTVFVPGPPIRDDEVRRFAVISSDPERARRAEEIRRKSQERERILRKSKKGKELKPRSEWDRGEARKLWEEGCSDGEIARRLGTSSSAVWYWRKNEGLPAVEKSNEIAKREALWRQGLTDKEIAARCGITLRCVQKWRYYHKLENNRKPNETQIQAREKREKMLAAWERGLTDREIAAEVGTSLQAVIGWRGRHHLLVNKR